MLVLHAILEWSEPKRSKCKDLNSVFFKRGEGVAADAYLGVPESIGHVPKMLQFENWNLIEHCFTGNTSNTTK